MIERTPRSAGSDPAEELAGAETRVREAHEALQSALTAYERLRGEYYETKRLVLAARKSYRSSVTSLKRVNRKILRPRYLTVKHNFMFAAHLALIALS